MVNHYVLRLYISVDNPPRMTEIQCLQNLKHVVSNIVVSESWVQLSVVDIIHSFKNLSQKKKKLKVNAIIEQSSEFQTDGLSQYLRVK